MNKLDMESIDIVKGNIDKIGELFPNVIVESENGKSIDFDLLKQELSNEIVEGNKEKYQLTWPGKKEAILNANTRTKKTLRPIREKSVDFDNTQNIYIEGDNLDALKILQESYLGKIKCIYIDPPYNTGNDFIYKDDYKKTSNEELIESKQIDEYGNRLVSNNQSNGRFHSDWLSMMYPRLKLARNLLTNDGVIFISIDENEVDNLTKMCDEIFGETNKIETIVWKNKYGAGAKTVGFISAHEYILCYSKNPITNITCEFEGEERNKYNKKDDKFDTRGPYRTQPLMTNSLGDRPNLMYSIFYNGVEIKPHKQWVWSKERMDEAIKNGDVEFSLQKDGSYSVRSKAYLYDKNGKIRRGKPVSVLNGPFTQDGTKEIRDLFNSKSIFDFTKPSALIQYLVGLEINDKYENDFIILDFFSGSATTAQAVMQLNAKNNGKRKYILIQLPEVCSESSEAYKYGFKNICEIGEERIRRASKKIKEETNADIDYGFRVYKVDSSNMKDVYYKPNEVNQMNLLDYMSNIKEDRTPEDLLTQVILDLGLTLDLKIEEKEILSNKVFYVENNSLVACFDDNVNIDIVNEICKCKPLKVIFRDSSFDTDKDKINLEERIKKLSPETEINIL